MNSCDLCTWIRRISEKEKKSIKNKAILCEQPHPLEKPYGTSNKEWDAKYNDDPENNAKKHCGKYSCNIHQVKCHDCKKQVCFDCRRICNHCIKDLCMSCNYHCDDCFSDVCKSCFMNIYTYHGYDL